MWREIIEYLDTAIAGFVFDPPDTDYQRGYLAALKEVREEVAAKEKKIYTS